DSSAGTGRAAGAAPVSGPPAGTSIPRSVSISTHSSLDSCRRRSLRSFWIRKRERQKEWSRKEPPRSCTYMPTHNWDTGTFLIMREFRETGSGGASGAPRLLRVGTRVVETFPTGPGHMDIEKLQHAAHGVIDQIVQRGRAQVERRQRREDHAPHLGHRGH